VRVYIFLYRPYILRILYDVNYVYIYKVRGFIYIHTICRYYCYFYFIVQSSCTTLLVKHRRIEKEKNEYRNTGRAYYTNIYRYTTIHYSSLWRNDFYRKVTWKRVCFAIMFDLKIVFPDDNSTLNSILKCMTSTTKSFMENNRCAFSNNRNEYYVIILLFIIYHEL
jgi:hypothetical protein